MRVGRTVAGAGRSLRRPGGTGRPAFRPQARRVAHDNPAAPLLRKITEEIPPHSVLSWPFRLSFVPSRDEEKQYGKYYPERLFEVRIEPRRAEIGP